MECSLSKTTTGNMESKFPTSSMEQIAWQPPPLSLNFLLQTDFLLLKTTLELLQQSMSLLRLAPLLATHALELLQLVHLALSLQMNHFLTLKQILALKSVLLASSLLELSAIHAMTHVQLAMIMLQTTVLLVIQATCLKMDFVLLLGNVDKERQK